MPASLRSQSSSSTLSLASEASQSTPGQSTPELVESEDYTFFPPLEEVSLPSDDGKEYIMIVGGLGYIGSHTTLELLQEGHNVVIVDDLSNCYEDVLPRIRALAKKYCCSHGVMMPTLRFHKMDYRSPATGHLLARYAASRSRISAVIHFAAFKAVSESIDHPLKYYRNNVCGLVDFLITLREHGIKNFVFSSSATVYGAKANRGKPLSEDDLVHFDEAAVDGNGKNTTRLNGAMGLTSPYGRSKYFAEAILADVARADPTMRITALRYFNPVGCHPSGLLREDPRQTPTNLFPVVASVVQGRKAQLDVFGTDWNTRDGTAIRDFIHVVDLARGHVAALVSACVDSKPTPFRAYNLGTGKGMTVAEVIASFERASNMQVPVVHASRRAGDVGSCVAATDRAEAELGWRAMRSVDDCARDCWTALTLAHNPSVAHPIEPVGLAGSG